MEWGGAPFADELLRLLESAIEQDKLAVGEHLLAALEAWVQSCPDSQPVLDHAYLSLMRCRCQMSPDRYSD